MLLTLLREIQIQQSQEFKLTQISLFPSQIPHFNRLILKYNLTHLYLIEILN